MPNKSGTLTPHRIAQNRMRAAAAAAVAADAAPTTAAAESLIDVDSLQFSSRAGQVGGSWSARDHYVSCAEALYLAEGGWARLHRCVGDGAHGQRPAAGSSHAGLLRELSARVRASHGGVAAQSAFADAQRRHRIRLQPREGADADAPCGDSGRCAHRIFDVKISRKQVKNRLHMRQKEREAGAAAAGGVAAVAEALADATRLSTGEEAAVDVRRSAEYSQEEAALRVGNGSRPHALLVQDGSCTLSLPFGVGGLPLDERGPVLWAVTDGAANALLTASVVA